MRGFRFATVEGQDIQWALDRNCSVTPAQLGWFYASLCALTLGIASVFWLHGATMVLPFAGVELVAVGAALLAYARHAADRERICLRGPRLVVEVEQGGRLVRTEFHRDWVRVEPGTDGRSLIELSGRGQSVRIGRYLRPELRPALAQEIRRALREDAQGTAGGLSLR